METKPEVILNGPFIRLGIIWIKGWLGERFYHL